MLPTTPFIPFRLFLPRREGGWLIERIEIYPPATKRAPGRRRKRKKRRKARTGAEEVARRDNGIRGKYRPATSTLLEWRMEKGRCPSVGDQAGRRTNPWLDAACANSCKQAILAGI